MRIRELQKQFEQIAPSAIAWKGDNIGLLIGRENDQLKNIVVALDVTMEVAEEAKKKDANCIITHHPLLFHPLKNITSSTRVGELVLYLAENNINLFAAHTNLDSVTWGVNFTLAGALGLDNVQVLSPVSDSVAKIVVFVPQDHLDAVASAMHDAGAGMFTQYDKCSYRSEGIGTFRGKHGAKPFIGKVGTIEQTREVRLEMLADQWKVGSILSAMVNAHPYEEVAYDVYPLLNRNMEYGIGAIGDLNRNLSQDGFLRLVKQKLGITALRYSGSSKKIRRVAVCGGSGTGYISDAVNQQADAMVTADVTYHTFQDVERKILLVDAGHYETEHIVLPVLAKKLTAMFKQNKHSGKVYITKHSTNPVHLF